MAKSTSLEQLQALASRVNQDFARRSALDVLEERIDDIDVPTNVSALTNDAGYQTQTEVAAAVAAAGHLERRKVTSVSDIDTSAADAGKCIYMVPNGTDESGNVYEEYMVLDGAVELIGSTTVDLSGYVEKETGKALSSNDYTDEEKAKLDGIGFATDAEVLAMLDEVFGAVSV